VKAQIQKDTGFPRIKYPVSSTGQAKAGLVKPGMTNCVRLMPSWITKQIDVLFDRELDLENPLHVVLSLLDFDSWIL
jgi:hypothetical protein